MAEPALSAVAFPAGRTYDLLCLGRAGVDLYAQQDDTPLQAVTSFVKSVGGSPANIATGAARLGLRVGMISVVSDDALGRYVRAFLAANGVDVRGVRTDVTGARISLAMTEMRPQDCAVIIFREGAADLQLTPADIDADAIAAARVLLVTGTALSAQPSREAALHALSVARSAGTVTVLDLDYRPYGWHDLGEAAVALRQAADRASIVIGNREEFAVLEGRAPGPAGSPGDALGTARALLSAGVDAVIVKDGARGCRILDRLGTDLAQGVFAVAARKPFGAGDAFAAALLWSLLAGHPWAEAARLGAAAAAINVAGTTCADAMPTRAALMTFIDDPTRLAAVSPPAP